ncbi:MAG: PilW family protein [Solirubrobacteraceae bacterium]
MRMRRRATALVAADGFTLVELLVSMVAGTILVLAILGVFDASVRQSQAATDRVEATQNGRIALEKLSQELNSSCIWSSVPTVQAGSDVSHIWFITAFSSTPLPNPVLHEVWLAPGGLLQDASYALTNSATPPAGWIPSAFNSTPSSTRTLATNVSYISGTSSLFQYYQYISGHLAIDATHQLATPLLASTASAVGAVTIGFAVGPSDKSRQANRTINLTDTATLVPPPGPGGGCQ